MAVTVKLPVQLRTSANGEREARVEGATVGEVLESLFASYPELRERISDQDGSLRRFVNVYVSGEDIRFLEGTKTPVAEGAELTILPAVAGG
jgi:sulfur-carrier protein